MCYVLVCLLADLCKRSLSVKSDVGVQSERYEPITEMSIASLHPVCLLCTRSS